MTHITSEKKNVLQSFVANFF